jgi:hypothetical protein
MQPNDYCDTDYQLDKTKNSQEVIDFVKEFIKINTGKQKNS